MKEREYNYDWLRVCSMIAVIMIHVSVYWVNSFTYAAIEENSGGALVRPFTAGLFYSLAEFAVPCFLMVSGAFIIDNDNNADYVSFYKKSFEKIGIPTLIFSSLYTLLNIMELLASEQFSTNGMVAIVRNLLSGWPYYHMWYMFMIIGIYLMAPFVIIIKNKIGYRSFRKAAAFFLVYAVLSASTTKGNTVNWDIGYSIYFLGYFMIGYILRKEAKKNFKIGCLLILSGIIVELIIAIIYCYLQFIKKIEGSECYLKPLSPAIVIASILIFAGFGYFNMRHNIVIEKMAELSFIIFLFHGGVWGTVKTVICKLKGDNYLMKLDGLWAIPVGIIVVLTISFVLSLAYEKLYNSIRKRFA